MNAWSAGNKKPVIIVENFKEIGESVKGEYSAGLARLVADDLRGLPSVDIITPDMRKSALEEITFSQLGGPVQINEEALLLAADYIITGSYLIQKDSVIITIELVRVSDQTIVESAKVEGQKTKIQERADAALFILISLLEQKGILTKTFTSEGITAVEQKRTAENNAFRYYSMASALRYSDPKAALDLYKKAIVSDPSYIDALIDAALVASLDLSLDTTATGYIAHAEKIIGQQGQKWSPQFARLMTARGLVHMNADRIAAAIDSLNAASNMLKYIGRGESYEMSEVLNDFGVAMRKTGKYAESFASYNESLVMMQRLGIEKTLPYAETLSNIAALQRIKKDYDSALEWNGKSKKLKEKLGLQKSKTYSLTLSNEGVILCDKKDYRAGLKLFIQAENIFENINLENTDDYARVLVNSGFALALLNEHEKAAEYLVKAQTIRKDIKKDETSEYAEASMRLAKSLSAQGKYCDALIEVKKGIVLKKRFSTITNMDMNFSAELESKCGY
jgi:tetratricopeptide (TPR) repeat protein